MSSIIWYVYEFARKDWLERFFDARAKEEIVCAPDRFKGTPKVKEEYCIGCGACIRVCPTPGAIKLIRKEEKAVPMVNEKACIRCGFCGEICPTKSIKVGLMAEETAELVKLIPHELIYSIDESFCVACGRCVEVCPTKAIEMDDTTRIKRENCIACGECNEVCPVEGAIKIIPVAEIESMREGLKKLFSFLESVSEKEFLEYRKFEK